MVKNLPANARDVGLICGSKDPLEEGMVTHSSILAWEIPRTEDLGGLQYMGSQRVRHDQAAKHVQDCLCKRLDFEKEAFGG